MSSPHTIFKRNRPRPKLRDTVRNARIKRETSKYARMSRKNCHCSRSRQRLYPLDRVQIFDTFLFSGRSFSFFGWLSFVLTFFSLFITLFTLFLSSFISTSFLMNLGFEGRGVADSPDVVPHVLCTKLQSAGASAVSMRHTDALKQGKERAIDLGAQHSYSVYSIA
jgi:hypothetical protein